MPGAVGRIAGLAQREAGEAAGGYAARAVLAGLAAIFVIVAGGFFVASATWALTFEHGVVVATSIVGAVFLVLAGVILLIARLSRRRRARAAAALRQRRQEEIRQLAVESSLDALMGLAGFSARHRLVAPLAAGIALGWYAERRLRRGRAEG